MGQTLVNRLEGVFLFAMEFSRKQIEHAAFQSWKQTKEGKALDAQMSQADKVVERALHAVPWDSDAAYAATHNATNATLAYSSAFSAAEEEAVEQAVASRWPFSGIIRARDYGRAFLECVGVVVLTAIGFLFGRFRQRGQEHASA